MILLSDKTLLFSVAEDHAQRRAQQLESQMGKILRINLDGSIPRNNPFVSTPGAAPEIWSYGHRVPTGLYEDLQTREIWETEPGPRGGDELNLIRPGANYGWAEVSWGFAYDGKLEAPAQTAAGIEDPIAVWTPSHTPSGIARYRGPTYPSWSGDYFIGNLNGKALVRLRIRDRKVVLQERMLLDLNERIREVKVGPDNPSIC
jgi:glucose/arabinose dehydrogenase